MSGLTDFVKYSLSSSGARAKSFIKGQTSLKGALKTGAQGQVGRGGVFDINRDKNFLGEDADRLFVGEPEKPLTPEAPGKTLKAVEGRDALPAEEAARRRRAATLANSQPLGRKSILGG